MQTTEKKTKNYEVILVPPGIGYSSYMVKSLLLFADMSLWDCVCLDETQGVHYK